MSAVRRAVKFIKKLFVLSAVSPLFLSVQSTLPGRRQLLDAPFSVCDEETLDVELHAKRIDIVPDLRSRFNTGVRQILSPNPDDRRSAVTTFQDLLETPLQNTSTVYVNLGVAKAMANQLQEGLADTNLATEHLINSPLAEDNSTHITLATVITDNKAEIERRLENFI